MVIACILIGILFIFCGIFCIASPIGAYSSVMTLFASMMFVFGIFGIIRFFKRRALVPELIISILAVLIGFYYLFRPYSAAAAGFDSAVLGMVAAWFVLKGCVSIYFSIKTRFVNNRWIFILISGILSLILGIYSFMNPILAASSVGILLGMWYIECGVDLIALGSAAGYIQGAVDATRENIQNAVQEVQTAAREYSEELNARAAEGAPSDAPETIEPVETVEVTDAPDGPVDIPIQDPKQPE